MAVVGGDTLLAREIRSVLENEQPAARLQLISSNVDDAQVLSLVGKEVDEEAVVMAPLSAETLEGSKVAFLAGSAASSRRALKMNPKGGPRLIDLTGSLEDQPEARLRAPSVEPAGLPKNGAAIQVIAHPAAIALTTLLAQLGTAAPIRRSVAHVFEPASERGQRGLTELQKQTVAVLAFKKLPQEVFDTQLAFSMLARYGEEAVEPLEGIEQRVERHVASLLTHWPGVPMPSVRLIQAPVFHGHSLSVWVEFERNPGAPALIQQLEVAGFDVRTDDPPANAGIAGLSGLSVGAITVDRNNPRACWFWLVADNLRVAAENAVAVAKEIA
jgi:aspartate-semialdehyde dehydrogenase